MAIIRDFMANLFAIFAKTDKIEPIINTHINN
jgi:hypothetical protein